jgi:regulator of ribonuclease activity B
MSEEREWYEQLLELQLRANPAILERLRELGVTEETQLRLGFIYLAPGEQEAQRLEAFLREQTDYELQTRRRRKGFFEHPEWLVIGATQPTTVTRETIDAWVEWMVAAGAAEGPCAFDGWTSEIVA